MTATQHVTEPGFGPSDFDVFRIDGLEPRMAALIERIRPKLTELGARLAPELSAMAGEEMFAHVAKHARRTVHPPNDTWVAWAANKRGYKMLPHFQFGLFESHAFAQFAIIYECEQKASFARALEASAGETLRRLPDGFVWSMDHMKPDGTPLREMTEQSLQASARKLAESKSAEALVGIRLDRDDPLLASGDRLRKTMLEAFEALMPLYRMSRTL